ncbi:MAG: Ppx/GppA family phosphatase [Methanoregulaceae archaeon]|nr:Ppx/GppA family phosphatase [Methanoregulaceae archaeon]
MTGTKTQKASRIVTFIDIGTNSIRLFVVKLNPDCSYIVLTSQKESVRLGEGEFETGLITGEAMDRAVMVAGRFVELAHSFYTEEFVAVATSATREAQNRYEFLSRLRKEAHLDVQVISGREEARLIFMGVAAAMHLEKEQIMVIDIGGGSTEVAIGGNGGCNYLSSLRLGSIRLTNMFFPCGVTEAVTESRYEEIRNYVRNEIKTVIRQARNHPVDLVVGSSGTIINLCDIAARLFHPGDPNRTYLTSSDLKKTVPIICSLSLAERRKIPGINPERADIIITGMAIIDTLMEELNIAGLEVTQRGLQDGLLADYTSKMEGFPLLGHLSVREKSVLLTGRAFGINEYHARTVSTIALELFDTGIAVGLHTLGPRERELLEYASFLHDIGSLISFNNHHAHSYYIIRNSELLGFDNEEVLIMANIARYHRKKLPKKKELEMPELDEQGKLIVTILSTFLRLSESLDRRHAALIERVFFSGIDNNTAKLNILAREDCQFESWGVDNEAKNFERTFGLNLDHTIVRSDIHPGTGNL